MLTEQEKRVLIAKAQGFTVRYNSGKDLFELIDPGGNWKHPYDAEGSESHCWNYSPDYFHDLNAMYEAEKMIDAMPVDTRSLWLDYLGLCCEWPKTNNAAELRFEISYLIARSTAAQRAEAFGLTLKLWT